MNGGPVWHTVTAFLRLVQIFRFGVQIGRKRGWEELQNAENVAGPLDPHQRECVAGQVGPRLDSSRPQSYPDAAVGVAVAWNRAVVGMSRLEGGRYLEQ